MDSGGATCAVILFVLVAGVIWIVYQQNQASRLAAKRLREAHDNYRASLSHLKQRPSDPDLRQRTLELGRHYSSLTRDSKVTTVFDEVALSNDLNAACAGAGQAQDHPIPQYQPSTEERLIRLKDLLDKSLITDAEYQSRRAKLLDDV